MSEHDKAAGDPLDVPRLAAEGGPAAVPGGPPAWPRPDPRVREQLWAAASDGSWGRYHARFSDQLIARLCCLLNVSHTLLTCSGTIAVELASSTILMHHPALLLPEQNIQRVATAFRKVSHWFGR